MSEYNFERALDAARAVSSARLHLRADSGFCSQHMTAQTLQQVARLGRQVDLLIKWDLRTATVEKIVAQRYADKTTVWTRLREIKRECV